MCNGNFFIAGKDGKVMHSIHDVVKLCVPTGLSRKSLKTEYNLEELKDLESKLVLITGNKVKNREGVDRFLNVCKLSLFFPSVFMSMTFFSRFFIACVVLQKC